MPQSPHNNEVDVGRRAFVHRSLTAALGAAAGSMLSGSSTSPAPASNMRFGLVTYQWGRDWELPELIRNCQRARAYGVELRVDHAHGVGPQLSPRGRKEVRLRFANSPVELVGLGTNWAFHYPDPAEVRMELEGAKEWVRLSHDVGGTGVKVKPNALPDGVPIEKTVEQIGRALRNLGRYAEDYGQEIRVEVHGTGTQQLPVMRRIMEAAGHPNVVVCWNSNAEDLDGEGLAHNFDLVKNYFGRTVHVREFDVGDYPYSTLMGLLQDMDYDGWILLEARTEPADRVAALAAQRERFDELVGKAEQATR